MIKLRTLVFAAVASFTLAQPSLAQWQVPDHSVPIGRGGGAIGFKNVAPGTSGYVWTSNGPGADPSYQTLPPFGTVTSITLQGGVSGTPSPITGAGTVTADANYSGFATSNCTLSASVGSNTLTVALKTNAGADPTAAQPCNINYRNSTISNGSTSAVSQTSALSVNTFAVGASLGSSNNVPFRLWVVVFNNAGTNVLALVNCSTATSVAPLNEGGVATSVAFTAGATSAGVFYTPNGTTVSAKAFRILGYVEYGSGLATAGSYVSLPTAIQVFGPGIKKPGDIVQDVYVQNSTVATTGNTYTLSATLPTPSGGILIASQSITPTATMNPIRVQAQGVGATSASSSNTVFIYDATNSVTKSVVGTGATGGGGILFTLKAEFQTVNISSPTTYAAYFTSNTGTTTLNGVGGAQYFTGAANSFIRIQEIMG